MYLGYPPGSDTSLSPDATYSALPGSGMVQGLEGPNHWVIHRALSKMELGRWDQRPPLSVLGPSPEGVLESSKSQRGCGDGM